MALVDFLGDTAEIKIIDFLLQNNDQEYNQTELAACTGLSRTTIYEKLPLLMYNQVIKNSRTVGRSKLFQIQENEIFEGLVKAVFANSFLIAGENIAEKETIEQIVEEIDFPFEEDIHYVIKPRRSYYSASGYFEQETEMVSVAESQKNPGIWVGETAGSSKPVVVSIKTNASTSAELIH